MAVNEILASVSLVVQLHGGQPIGTATGFFFDSGGSAFFVTNKHVVQGDQVKPERLRLRLHTDETDISKNEDYEIPLYGAQNEPLWKTSLTSAAADVAVLKLDKAALARFSIRYWGKGAFLPSKYTLNPGEDVFIIGYPLGFHDNKHNLPVLRGGMVASAYAVPFQGEPLFLTDINLHPGTSGSPVIAKPKNAWVNQENGNTEFVTGTAYYLLGIHSGTLNLGGNPLGLGAAWYASLIEEIAAQFP